MHGRDRVVLAINMEKRIDSKGMHLGEVIHRSYTI